MTVYGQDGTGATNAGEGSLGSMVWIEKDLAGLYVKCPYSCTSGSAGGTGGTGGNGDSGTEGASAKVELPLTKRPYNTITFKNPTDHTETTQNYYLGAETARFPCPAQRMSPRPAASS